MNLLKMSSSDLIQFLKANDVSWEICDLLAENEIDGSTLMDLTNDIEEFKTVLPKSGHRLKVKKVINQAENEEGDAGSVCSGSSAISSKYITDLTDNDTNQDESEEDSTGNIDCIDEGIIVVNHTMSTPTPTASKNSVVRSKQFAEMNDDQKPSTPLNRVKSELEGKRKYGNSPLPDPLPFPNNFSVAVQQAIDNGSVLSVRRHLVNDIGSFYFGLTSHPQQGDYKRIALLICKKFPELRDSTPSNYWLSLQKQLSQFFRNARRKSTPTCEASGSPDSGQVKSAKRVKLFNDDPEAQKRNLELLKNARAGAMSKKTYVSLVAETFAERRTFVTNTARSSAEVLEMCPYLGKQEHVRNEVNRILGKDTLKGAEKRLAAACKSLVMKDGELSSEDVVNAISIVESKNGKKRLTNLLKFKDPSSTMDSMVKDKLVQFRLLCIGCPEDVRQLMIIGENKVFVECQLGTSLISGLIDLICAYYAFDVMYPDGMIVVLSFLQEIVLQSSENAYKGTKYSALMTEVRSRMSAAAEK